MFTPLLRFYNKYIFFDLTIQRFVEYIYFLANIWFGCD